MSQASVPTPLAFLGESPVVAALQNEIELAARTHAKVLIVGETGTGKEVIARMIHAQSSRRERAFVALNSSGVPDTLLESELFGHWKGSFTGAFRDKIGLVRLADHGTLFLDELGEMSLRMQAVLLRFVETGEVQPIGADRAVGRADVRIITSTNRDLRAQIDAQLFRGDLFHRLNVVQIRVPPLRERIGDVRLLLAHFLRQAGETHSLPCPEITPAAEEVLTHYDWPGNVRELKNLAERLVVQQRRQPIAPDDLPSDVRRENHVTVVVEGNKPPPSVADELWDRLAAGDDFWSVVHRPFKSHDITRHDVRTLIQRGLRETRGSYRDLATRFHLGSADYKRFLGFLHQHDCHMPFQVHRSIKNSASQPRTSQKTYGAAS